MKARLLLLTVLIAAALGANAQTYTVIHAIGKIYESKSGKYLTKGMRLSESAELKFETSGAKAAVLSSKRGRFVIQEKSSSSSGQGELAYALAAVLSPARGRLSTRAGGINNQLDFQKKFGEGPVAIVGDEYKVAVSPTAYPMSDNKFFYASYSYNGEPINKKLSRDGDSLVFDVPAFYSVDDKPIDPTTTSDTKLFYYNAGAQESTLITALELSIITKDDLKSIVESLADLPAEEKKNFVLEIVTEFYGKCSDDDVEKALNSL
ncbi:MAG: hypothetical protein JXQ96_07825 [Cyclobacteriaceae bacterium]